jgi:Asp-tRNA(Asn)/Glu-tRNA(Gln) amidotransferase A subunit family amidase
MAERGAADWAVLEARAAISEGRITARAYAESLCDRNRERDGRIGVWAHYDEAAFLAAAAGGGEGALGGLAVGVKDILDTHDMPTECGSALLAGRRPMQDAAAVAAVRGAGGVVMGKTVTTEFAFFHPGRTRNPHDPECTPGGSSSGSAAAVAAGIVPLAIGTQTAGSVIRPAAFCGVVGFKPSFGRINRAGVQPFAESLDTVGAFARRVADAWLLVEVMSGETRPRPLEPARPTRIGLCRTPEWEAASPESRAAVEAAAEALARAGAEVRETRLADAGADLQQVQRDIMAHEAARVFAHFRRVARDGLSDALNALLAAGEAIAPACYRARLAEAALAREGAAAAFAETEVILTPSAIGEAPKGLDATGDPVFNRVWTMIGGPAVHLPTGRGPARLPVGVQLVAAPGADARLAAAALWAEQVLTG